MDTKFSSAIHTLILISESPIPMTSEQIAKSVGTNASYIRKIISLLKKQNLIQSQQGKGGFALTLLPDQLSLMMIYQAIQDESDVHIFDLHQNPNDQCIVGHIIKPVLTAQFRSIEKQIEVLLANKTLKDVIEDCRKQSNEFALLTE